VPPGAAELDRLRGADMLEELAGRCEALRSFWLTARTERSGAFWASGYLLEALRKRAEDVESGPTFDVTNDALLAADTPSIADLIHRAMRRWEAKTVSGLDPRDRSAPDVEDRLSEFLALWHRGVLLSSAPVGREEIEEIEVMT
jgi:hypothetical protein